jgi:hypothetical protein
MTRPLLYMAIFTCPNLPNLIRSFPAATHEEANNIALRLLPPNGYTYSGVTSCTQPWRTRKSAKRFNLRRFRYSLRRPPSRP